MLRVKLAYKWIDDMLVFSIFCVGSIFKDEIQVFNINICQIYWRGRCGDFDSFCENSRGDRSDSRLEIRNRSSGRTRSSGLVAVGGRTLFVRERHRRDHESD